MKLSHFGFELPQELIARYPSRFRDECRLMVVHKNTGKIEHKNFGDIVNYFGKDDCFVFNNTKVFPARLYGKKEKAEGEIEVFLLRELNEKLKLWDVLVDPARKIRIGNKLFFNEDESIVAEVIDNTTSRGRTLRFLNDMDHDSFKKKLYELGETPLPKYMGRRPEPEDEERYQSIFATEEGAVVAPAANLHFSKILMKKLELKDIRLAYITIHNGRGVYKEIDVEDLTKHKMDSEQMFIGKEACDIVNYSRDLEKKICIVGAATLRAIETAVSTDIHIKEYEGWTNKFIFPPYEFQLPNALVSNFHQPYSPLLMMVAAFGGYDLIMKAYEKAIEEKYAFGDYGDAMLVI